MIFIFIFVKHAKFRTRIIFVNLKSNIRVETCLCTHAVAFEFLV
jgi:hypothetical protein